MVAKSDIEISELGVSRKFFKKTLAHIKWRDVATINLIPVSTFTPRGDVTLFVLYRKNFNRRRNIRFTEEVCRVEMLVDTLNCYVKEYEISLFAGSSKNNQVRLEKIELSNCIAAGKRRE